MSEKGNTFRWSVQFEQSMNLVGFLVIFYIAAHLYFLIWPAMEITIPIEVVRALVRALASLFIAVWVAGTLLLLHQLVMP